MTTKPWGPWNFRDQVATTAEGRDLSCFEVHAIDGHIGKIDSVTTDMDSSHIVVDTGPWTFGKKLMLPAGTIERIDWDDAKVYVDRTKTRSRTPHHWRRPP